VVVLSSIVLDVVENVAYLSTGPLLWLFLYLFAWESPALARASGFGRLTFWLLLPGSLVGTISNAPFVLVGPAVVAINVGGGVIPIVLSLLLLRRFLGPRGSIGDTVALLFVVETLGGLAWVIAAGSATVGPIGLADVGVVVLALLPPLALAGLFPRSEGLKRGVWVLGFAGVALLLTYFTTAAVPGTGIVSGFPGYLLAPAVVGVGTAVLALRRNSTIPLPDAFASAYATATFGVLVGADVLRQPPLYEPPAAAIYSIGGAGLLDLLYLTGLVALAAGVLAYGLLRVGSVVPAWSAPTAPGGALSPGARLRNAFARLRSGDLDGAAAESATAARESRTTARALSGLPAAPLAGHPWGELGAPPWVDADQANLEALAARPGLTARDAWRAHVTARHLTRIGTAVTRAHFGSAVRRGIAFSIDAAFLLVPAVAIWTYLARTLPGSVDDVLASAPFNAAAYGYAAYAFAYFVLGERLFGTTVGKWFLGLVVRDRGLRVPAMLPVVVRDAPKLIPLTLLGVGGAAATVLLLRSPGLAAAGGTAAGVGVPSGLLALENVIALIIVGLGLCAVASALVMFATTEHQRLGDVIAGTWVIQEERQGRSGPGRSG